jgi:hypothetical protein
MNIGTTAHWPTSRDDSRPVFRSRDRLGVPAAILDGVCLSALLWFAVLLIVR